jgi:hypothetical protein
MVEIERPLKMWQTPMSLRHRYNHVAVKHASTSPLTSSNTIELMTETYTPKWFEIIGCEMFQHPSATPRDE